MLSINDSYYYSLNTSRSIHLLRIFAKYASGLDQVLVLNMIAIKLKETNTQYAHSQYLCLRPDLSIQDKLFNWSPLLDLGENIHGTGRNVSNQGLYLQCAQVVNLSLKYEDLTIQQYGIYLTYHRHSITRKNSINIQHCIVSYVGQNIDNRHNGHRNCNSQWQIPDETKTANRLGKILGF